MTSLRRATNGTNKEKKMANQDSQPQRTENPATQQGGKNTPNQTQEKRTIVNPDHENDQKHRDSNSRDSQTRHASQADRSIDSESDDMDFDEENETNRRDRSNLSENH